MQKYKKSLLIAKCSVLLGFTLFVSGCSFGAIGCWIRGLWYDTANRVCRPHGDNQNIVPIGIPTPNVPPGSLPITITTIGGVKNTENKFSTNDTLLFFLPSGILSYGTAGSVSWSVDAKPIHTCNFRADGSPEECTYLTNPVPGVAGNHVVVAYGGNNGQPQKQFQQSYILADAVVQSRLEFNVAKRGVADVYNQDALHFGPGSDLFITIIHAGNWKELHWDFNDDGEDDQICKINGEYDCLTASAKAPTACPDEKCVGTIKLRGIKKDNSEIRIERTYKIQ